MVFVMLNPPFDAIHAYIGYQLRAFNVTDLWSELGEIRTRAQYNEETEDTIEDEYGDGEYRDYPNYFDQSYSAMIYHPMMKK